MYFLKNSKILCLVLIFIFTLATKTSLAQGEPSELIRDEYTVGLWHFSEGDGTRIKDSSGEGNNGKIYGATWTQGKFGTALKFQGKDDYVKVPHSKDLNITDKITVEAWVKLDVPVSEQPSSYPIIAGKMARKTGYGIYLQRSENRIMFGFKDPENKWHQVSVKADTCEPGKWYHIMGTYDRNVGIEKNLQLYINGVLFKAVTSTSFIGTNSASFVMGSSGFKGSIDEVRISNVSRFGGGEPVTIGFEEDFSNTKRWASGRYDPAVISTNGIIATIRENNPKYNYGSVQTTCLINIDKTPYLQLYITEIEEGGCISLVVFDEKQCVHLIFRKRRSGLLTFDLRKMIDDRTGESYFWNGLKYVTIQVYAAAIKNTEKQKYVKIDWIKFVSKPVSAEEVDFEGWM